MPCASSPVAATACEANTTMATWAGVKAFIGDSAYCFRWNGRVQIKRLQLIGKDRVRILSANPDYPPVDVLLADIEIGGRAVAAWTLTEF